MENAMQCNVNNVGDFTKKENQSADVVENVRFCIFDNNELEEYLKDMP